MKTIYLLVAKVTILSFFILISLPAVLTVSSANAAVVSADANDNALVDTFCNGLNLLTGNAGKVFAAFAIISMGIGFLTGKISWGLMIGVALGIAAVFGAPTIVSALSGSSTFDCS